MNHLDKRLKERFPYQELLTVHYTKMQEPATVQCCSCKNEYTLKQAFNFLRANKKCVCKKCINNKSSGRLSIQEFQLKIDKLYPNESLTVLNYTLKNRPCSIKCNNCGQIWTLQNAESFYNKHKKYVCKNCYPNKNNLMQQTILKFYTWKDNQNNFIFKTIPKKINSKTLIKGICVSCGKESEKNIYDYLKNKKCKYCAKNILKTIEEYQKEIGEEYTVLQYNGMNHRSKFKHNLCGFCYEANSASFLCPRCKGTKGERKIRSWLLKNNIAFQEQKIFIINGHKLRVDFYLPLYNYVIEYNGQQHYRPIDFFGGETTFKRQQLYDSYKRQYFKNKMFEISYIEYNDINFLLNGLLQTLKSSSTISMESKGAETVAL